VEVPLPQKQYYVYVSGGNYVSMYSINKITGQLNALSPATIRYNYNATGASSISTLAIGSKSYAYVPSTLAQFFPFENYTSVLSMYSINSSNGQLTDLNPDDYFDTGRMASFSDSYSISTITLGVKSYAYVTYSYDNTVSMYSINNSTGQLTAFSPATVDTGASPTCITTITIGANSYAYVTNTANPSSISMYSINNSTGELTAFSTISTSFGPMFISTITIGVNSYAYVCNNNSVSMYSINSSSGQLTALSPGSIASGINSVCISTITLGVKSYAYVCNNGDGTISMYSIDGSSGQLTALSPATISTGSESTYISTITIGIKSYAYVCNNNNTVSMYFIDSSSGQLTALSSPTIGTTLNPLSISIIGF